MARRSVASQHGAGSASTRLGLKQSSTSAFRCPWCSKVEKYHYRPHDNVVQFVPLQERRIEAMSHKGVHGLNETLLALTMDRLDAAHSVEDVIYECSSG